MNVARLLDRAAELGIVLVLDGDLIRYRPASIAPTDFIEALRENKSCLIEVLAREARCLNSIVSHKRHEYPWECDPNSCLCYRQYGYPFLCQGMPCRWTFPDGIPGME